MQCPRLGVVLRGAATHAITGAAPAACNQADSLTRSFEVPTVTAAPDCGRKASTRRACRVGGGVTAVVQGAGGGGADPIKLENQTINLFCSGCIFNILFVISFFLNLLLDVLRGGIAWDCQQGVEVVLRPQLRPGPLRTLPPARPRPRLVTPPPPPPAPPPPLHASAVPSRLAT